MSELRVVCYLNQFFGQIGGVDKAGIGPQAPRDLTKIIPGTNPVTFAKAPPADKMRLCNVHFHAFAEQVVAFVFDYFGLQFGELERGLGVFGA